MDHENFGKKVAKQFGCSEEHYQQIKKETLDQQKAHPLICKLRFWFSVWLFIGAAALMFFAWKNSW